MRRIHSLVPVFLLVAACASPVPAGSPPAPSVNGASTASPTVAASPSAAPPSASAAPTTSDGAFVVGARLAPGTYTSVVFATPLTFKFPDGWKVFEDELGQFGLALLANDGPCVCSWRDVRAAAASGVESAQSGVGPSADAITTWLAKQPGIKTTTPKPVTIGGLHGFVIDLHVAAAGGGAPTVVGTSISRGVWWGVTSTSEQRLYLLDIGPNGSDGNIAINVEVCCGVEFDQRTATVAPVIATFAFAATKP
ncbi:MAG: hypothetical protein ABI628_05535 [Chloroflexota bacterium]